MNRVQLNIVLKIVFVLPVLFFLRSCVSNEKLYPGNKETTVQVDRTLKDMGEVNQYDIAEAVFKIKNTGAAALALSSVTTDCHCTLVSWDSLPVKPNMDAVVKVRYDTRNIGFFQQAINIELNTKQKYLTCLIRGKVVGK